MTSVGRTAEHVDRDGARHRADQVTLWLVVLVAILILLLLAIYLWRRRVT